LIQLAYIYVSSSQNSLLKEYKRLQNSSQHRRKKGRIALEGPNLVRAALNKGLVPQVVFYTQDYYDSDGRELLNDLPPKVKQVILTPTLFNNIASTETPQAVAAISAYDYKDKDRAEDWAAKLVLVLDRVRDPGNMGTIIRTAAAVGVDIIFYTSGSADPYNPKVLRATAGSIFSVPVKLTGKPLMLLRRLKQKGLQVVASAVRSDCSYWSVDYRAPTVLLIGNETDGITEELSSEADFCVSIPLAEPVESLNAAVAAALMLYEVIRQRRP